jgi:tRNA 2-thiouridine synthesizing protein B
LAKKDDCILLIENAVYAAIPAQAENWLFFGEEAPQVCALAEDLRARGLLECCDPRINIVDYDGFAALTERYPSNLTWS